MKVSPTQPCVLGISSQHEGKSLCGFIKYTKVVIKKKKKQSADSEGFRWEVLGMGGLILYRMKDAIEKVMELLKGVLNYKINCKLKM